MAKAPAPVVLLEPARQHVAAEPLLEVVEDHRRARVDQAVAAVRKAIPRVARDRVGLEPLRPRTLDVPERERWRAEPEAVEQARRADLDGIVRQHAVVPELVQ